MGTTRKNPNRNFRQQYRRRGLRAYSILYGKKQWTVSFYAVSIEFPTKICYNTDIKTGVVILTCHKSKDIL